MTVSKISADTNPVILRMAVAGQNISLKAAIDGSGETVTEYSLKSRWFGVYMSKKNNQTISPTSAAYYLSSKNGFDLNSGDLQTQGYTDAQFEALFAITNAADLLPLTVQQVIALSKTKSSESGASYCVHQVINFSTRADGRSLTGVFKDNSAPTASVVTNGTTATITITPNGTNAVHEYGSRIWYLVDNAATHTYKEITEQGESRYVRGSSNETVTAQIPASGSCYLHMARRSINTQTVVSTPARLR